MCVSLGNVTGICLMVWCVIKQAKWYVIWSVAHVLRIQEIEGLQGTQEELVVIARGVLVMELVVGVDLDC